MAEETGQRRVQNAKTSQLTCVNSLQTITKMQKYLVQNDIRAYLRGKERVIRF